MTKKAEIITFGCRLNIYESEILKQGIKEHKVIDTAIFNSCAVTSESVRQVKQSIRKRRREFPDEKIIVTGCAAQIEPETFSKMQEVDLVSGNIEKRDILNILSKESQCHWFCNSWSLISNSSFKSSTVLSTDFFNISETPIKIGLLPSITQEFGDIDISQLVNANNASIILSGDTPDGR